MRKREKKMRGLPPGGSFDKHEIQPLAGHDAYGIVF